MRFLFTFFFGLLLSAGVVLALPSSAFSAENTGPDARTTSAFRSYKNINPTVSVPTAIEVPFDQETLTLPFFAVYDLTASEFEPYLLHQTVKAGTPHSVSAANALGNAATVKDGNYQTYLEFPSREDVGNGPNTAEMSFAFDRAISASSLSFSLDTYVALPKTIAVYATVAGKPYTVLAPTRLTGTRVTFPKTTASTWRVVFEYVQPLRIVELKIDEISSEQSVKKGLRFLAEPGHTYRVYFDADRYVQSTNKESGNLSNDTGVVRVASPAAIANPQFTPADSDQDSIPDLNDNCVSSPNTDQKDSDGNGRGDVCEDYDRDGLIAALDNCPLVPNRDQIDTDNDGVGDVCDEYENRVTERLPWLPWLGIGIAGIVLAALFVLAMKHKPNTGIENDQSGTI